MEIPVIGKRTDVFNKKAIMALSRGDENLALKMWEEALAMKEEHHDTAFNYLVYKWQRGLMSDNQLAEELEKRLGSGEFGAGMRGMIELAFGNLDNGKKML